MMSQYPRSEHDFEKTLVYFSNRVLTKLASSCDKSLMLDSYISCKCSGKDIASVFMVRICSQTSFSHPLSSKFNSIVTGSHMAAVSFFYSLVGKLFKFSRRKGITWL